jgi:hypothetical protein
MMPKIGLGAQTMDDEELLGGASLREALGFHTGEAFRAAARNGRLPIKLVKIEGRRGWFASAREVRIWKAGILAKLGSVQVAGETPRKD